MSRPKKTSPTLQITIGVEQVQRAIKSNSGGCLIADAIKSQYPNLSGVSVDMATIRVTDRERGERYTYLTPPAAQHVLLSFDQGWPNPTEQLMIRGAVKITPITRPKSGKYSPEGIRATREVRHQNLQAKVARGEPLTMGEKKALTRLSKPYAPNDRPSTTGPTEVLMDTETHQTVIRGGRPILQGQAHPNLLRGRNRHFGAKLADPGEVFRQAVDAAIAERDTQEGA